jgi:hypothetical protein
MRFKAKITLDVSINAPYSRKQAEEALKTYLRRLSDDFGADSEGRFGGIGHIGHSSFVTVVKTRKSRLWKEK